MASSLPGEALVGHQDGLLHGKGGQALKGLPRAGMEFPSLEVSRKGLDVELSAVVWLTK